MAYYRCTNCSRPYPESGFPYRCLTCGGIYDFLNPLEFTPISSTAFRSEGIWRFRTSLALLEEAPVVTLGEGNTPLVWGEFLGRPIALKIEGANPTGSFKDRGTAVLTSFLLSRGITAAVEDSSGNAGASFAAYAARAGIAARVFIPEAASGPKRDQIAVFGAEVVTIQGPRSQAAEAVMQAVEQGAVYASHALHPAGLSGYATVAYELMEQMDPPPATVIVPAGQGNLLLGISRGFQALVDAGQVHEMPHMVGVQARACAPLWAFFHYGGAGLGWVSEGETLAEGARVAKPMRGDAVIRAVEDSGGTMVAVDEDDILPARDALADQGIYVEPTSAIAWAALTQLEKDIPYPVALILTGSGLKTRQVDTRRVYQNQ